MWEKKSFWLFAWGGAAFEGRVDLERGGRERDRERSSYFVIFFNVDVEYRGQIVGSEGNGEVSHQRLAPGPQGK